MKESYNEEIANHVGPESCECDLSPSGRCRERHREDALEALTGEPTGPAIEPRNQVINREADLPMVWGRQDRMRRTKAKDVFGSRAIQEPGHVAKLLTRKPGDLGLGLSDMASEQVRECNPKGVNTR